MKSTLLGLALCGVTAVSWAQTAKRPVTLEIAAAQRPEDGLHPIWSPGGNSFVYVEGRTLHLYDCAAKSSKSLLALSDLESKAKTAEKRGANAWQNRRVASMQPQWTADGKALFLSVSGDLFLLDVASGNVRQVTATPESEEDPQISPDGKRIAYRFRNDLYVVDVAGGKPRRLTNDGSNTLWNARLDWVYPEELSLSRAWWWSPDSRDIAFLQFDVSQEMIHPHVDATPIEAVSEPQRFPKAGTPNANVRLGVVNASGGKVRWMDLGPTRDSLIARVQWIPGSRSLAVQRLTRVQDKLELLSVDTATGKPKTLLTEQDPAWVNIHDMLHFFADGRFLWASERDGHRHFYLYSNGTAKQLTSGSWEAINLPGIDEARGHVFFIGTKDSVIERHLYRLDIANGTVTRMTAQPGVHSIAMGPGGRWYLDSWRNQKQPLRQTLHDATGAEVAVLKKPRSYEEYDLLPSEYSTFRGKDGTVFHYQLIRPKNFDPAKKYPAIVMVYGGPHAQTVIDSWAGPNWDQALAHKGYVIWRMDNRGSNYRGHAFEAVVHKRFGKQELADQLEGVEHLVRMGFVDPAKIGIYGWSYGGYMTLYSMLNAPKTFAAGVAGAPVTDWRHYDTIYTERYMGLPAKNEEGYKASSPVYAAANLEGKLMLVHNFQDDNVLFQNSQHMMAALQRAGKQFENMFYPLKSHGVTGPLKLHLLQTVTGFFDRHLK